MDNTQKTLITDMLLQAANERIDSLKEYIEILKKGLKVLDFTATSFSMENHIPILLFGLDDPHNIMRAVMGEKIGTIVSENCTEQ